ncbi:nitrate- and nitrite sensing domain-containing protein [Streptomyces sp. NPDC020096]
MRRPLRGRWPGSRRLRDWRLRNRVLLLVLVPLIAIIPLAGVGVMTGLDTIQAARDTRDQTLLMQRISGLVNAIGEERDRTEVSLTGRGVSADADLARAQRATTSATQAFCLALRQYHVAVSALPNATQQLGARAEARLGDLDPLRASVTRLGSVAPTFTAYTTIINDLLDFTDQLAANTSDHYLNTLVQGLGSIQQIEEQTSLERGYLVAVLSSGGFTLEQKEDLAQAQAQFTSANNAIANDAPAAVVNLYQSTVSGNQIGAADGTLQAVADAAQENTPLSTLRTSESTAFDQMTAKLDAIRTVEQQVIVRMTHRAGQLLSHGRMELYENIAIIGAVVLISYAGATALARSVVRPLGMLRGSALDIADNQLPDVVRRLGDAKLTDATAADETVRVQPIAVDSLDEVGQVARAFDRVHFEAVRLAADQATMRFNVNAMFTNLSRRSECLVQRQLQLIDELEASEQSPSQLAYLFRLDHLATRMRRNNENLLVLAGEEQGRLWNRPVLLVDVVRAATAEVEQYERVTLGELPDVALSGHAATDVVHLVAELVENATEFSAPTTDVVVSGTTLVDGTVALDVTDAGLGMAAEELTKINKRFAEPPLVDVAVSRRMGLFVVGRLAAKHQIRVRLEVAATDGIRAVVTLPRSLLKLASEVDDGTGSAFDLAMRPGSYDTIDLSEMLDPAASWREVADEACEASSRGHERPSSDGFSWFADETAPENMAQAHATTDDMTSPLPNRATDEPPDANTPPEHAAPPQTRNGLPRRLSRGIPVPPPHPPRDADSWRDR